MKVYIAGKITGDLFYKFKFKAAERRLKMKGCTVMNPAILPLGFTQDEYLHICYAMIDTCDTIYFMKSWIHSAGALKENCYAKCENKTIIYE